MPTPPTTLVTAAQIARLAGVTRATVSNWRRRHSDFPAPAGGTDTRPAFHLHQVRAWLAHRGQLPPDSAADDLRAALPPHRVGKVERLWPLLLAASRASEADLKTVIDLPDRALVTRAGEFATGYATVVPGAVTAAYRVAEADLIRTLLRCVRREGAETTADVLAEGDGAGPTGTYPTPPPLTEVMADLLTEPGGGFPERVCDPACGAGGLLRAAAERGATLLYGQDILAPKAAQAAVRVSVTAPETTIDIRVGDSLRAPAFTDLAVDAVLCAPPYGARDWGHDQLAYDTRWAYGLPPKGEPELAWVQHCLAMLAEGHRPAAVLLLPPAVSERASGRRIRAELVRLGALQAVVALPTGAAAPWHVGLHLWLLRRPRPQEPTQRSVLFIDTASLSGADGEPTDWRRLRETVTDLWRSYLDEDGFDPVPDLAWAVPVVDLLDDQVDLTPARQVHTAPTRQPQGHADTSQALRSRLRRAAGALTTLSGGADWSPVGAEPRPWRTATVADLLRGGALTLLRPPGGRGSVDADDEPVRIAARDVILTEVFRHDGRAAEVATGKTVGRALGRDRCLLRPDPDRFDPWFLAGFLAAEDNLHAASTGTSIIRVDPRRLRVPLLPLLEQHHYGRAFRRLAALRAAADLTNRLADETTRALADGLTAGALLPPAADDVDPATPHIAKGQS